MHKQQSPAHSTTQPLPFCQTFLRFSVGSQTHSPIAGRLNLTILQCGCFLCVRSQTLCFTVFFLQKLDGAQITTYHLIRLAPKWLDVSEHNLQFLWFLSKGSQFYTHQPLRRALYSQQLTHVHHHPHPTHRNESFSLTASPYKVVYVDKYV